MKLPLFTTRHDEDRRGMHALWCSVVLDIPDRKTYHRFTPTTLS